MLVPSTGEWNKGIYSFPMRVYYEDTDLGGMVYHGRYISFLERVRSESIRDTVADVDALLAISEDDGGPIVYVVSNINIKYLRQSVVGDILIGHSKVTRIRAAAVEIEQWIMRGGERVVEAQLLVAIVNKETGRPCRWPVPVKQAWQQWLDESLTSNEIAEQN